MGRADGSFKGQYPEATLPSCLHSLRRSILHHRPLDLSKKAKATGSSITHQLSDGAWVGHSSVQVRVALPPWGQSWMA